VGGGEGAREEVQQSQDKKGAEKKTEKGETLQPHASIEALGRRGVRRRDRHVEKGRAVREQSIERSVDGSISVHRGELRFPFLFGCDAKDGHLHMLEIVLDLPNFKLRVN
jgi:hypothetical protein